MNYFTGLKGKSCFTQNPVTDQASKTRTGSAPVERGESVTRFSQTRQPPKMRNRATVCETEERFPRAVRLFASVRRMGVRRCDPGLRPSYDKGWGWGAVGKAAAGRCRVPALRTSLETEGGRDARGARVFGPRLGSERGRTAAVVRRVARWQDGERLRVLDGTRRDSALLGRRDGA